MINKIYDWVEPKTNGWIECNPGRHKKSLFIWWTFLAWLGIAKYQYQLFYKFYRFGWNDEIHKNAFGEYLFNAYKQGYKPAVDYMKWMDQHSPEKGYENWPKWQLSRYWEYESK